MSRGPLTFKLTDLKRALKGAAELGHQVIGFEITKAGSILVHTGKTSQPIPSTEDEWDKAISNDR